jgi:hypothetical protein
VYHGRAWAHGIDQANGIFAGVTRDGLNERAIQLLHLRRDLAEFCLKQGNGVSCVHYMHARYHVYSKTRLPAASL